MARSVSASKKSRRPSRSPSRSAASRSAAVTPPAEQTPHPFLCYPGGGTFFWWQLGAATRLSQLFDFSSAAIEQPGLSAGALAAVLSRCGVNPLEAHDVAYRLADDAGVFSNPMGLACKWGRLVEAWLRELLPENASKLCNRSAVVVVTRLTPLPRVARVATFSSNEHLISCLMASTHIPLFMDGHFSRSLSDGDPLDAGAARISAVDGGFLAFFGLATEASLLSFGTASGSKPVTMDANNDLAFKAACKAHGWSMLKPYGTEHFLEYGARYVEAQIALGADGALAPIARYMRKPASSSSKAGKARSWRRALPPMPHATSSRLSVPVGRRTLLLAVSALALPMLYLLPRLAEDVFFASDV